MSRDDGNGVFVIGWLNRTVRIQTLATVAVSLLAIAGVIVWITIGFWLDLFRAVARGSVDVAGERYVAMLPQADVVEVYLVAPLQSKYSADPAKRFEVWDLSYEIVAETRLEGETARELSSMWSRIPYGWGFSALCHEPAYGLKFIEKGQVVFVTSLCWKCSNFVLPTRLGYTLCGLNTKSTNAQTFWKRVQEHLPLLERPRAGGGLNRQP